MKIRIEKLEKSYGATQVLKGLSLEIEEGRFVSLLGPSGSGKTTLLRCSAGLETPDPSSGPISLGGETLSGPGVWIRPENRNLGMVFRTAVWPHLTARENVAFPLRIRRLAASGISPPGRPRALARPARRLGRALRPRASRAASSSEWRSPAPSPFQPRAPLLDEPLSNLDAKLRLRRWRARSAGSTSQLGPHHRLRDARPEGGALALRPHRAPRPGPDRGRRGARGALRQAPHSFRRAVPLGRGDSHGCRRRHRVFIPRRWRLADDGGSFGEFTVISRLFLGSEYEYWARSRARGARPVLRARAA